jgi:hypothetical protein
MNRPRIVLITSGSVARMGASSENWGRLSIAVDDENDIFGVVGTSDGDGELVQDTPREEPHPITSARHRVEGLWAIAAPGVHDEIWRRRRQAMPVETFLGFLPGLPPERRPDYAGIVVTRTPWLGLAAWFVGSSGVIRADGEVLRAATDDPIRDLGIGWPVRDLDRRVVVVGVGSIGSVTVHALAQCGVRDLTLVDDDRLRSHNLVRHQGARADVGRYKVDAVRDAIVARWPGTRVSALRENVITDADRMRPLFRGADLVVCAADGVAARRSVSRLARRAEVTAVFACVLRDGALGEVLRVRPWKDTACLLCTRAALVDQGVFNPEPALDAAYGAGVTHRPMTAVGSDLTIVGAFAAKVAVSTLLEEAGHYEHVMRQDWALIGLRMDRGAPEPFDLFPGQTHWLPEVPRREDCPACGSPTFPAGDG